MTQIPAPKSRLPRDGETRVQAQRPMEWAPASALPEPDKQAGYTYRWIRVAAFERADPKNTSAKLRQGWEPVRIEEQQKFAFYLDPNSRFKDNIEIGGLLLCKIPDEFAEQRRQYFATRTKAQLDSVDQSFLRQNDARMPLFSEKRSQTSFGTGN